ncbi:MAG: diguanylate cyclase domain-containing protein [Halorhodospira sp.]
MGWPLRVVLIYIVLGLLWIFGTDLLLVHIFPAPWLPTIQVLKGVAYVLVTAALLYGLLCRLERWQQAAGRHRESEALIRGREQAYASLAEQSPDLIMRFNHQLQIRYANRSACEQLGVARGAVLGRSLRELGVAAEVVAPWEEALRQARDEETVTRVAFQWPAAAGEERYLESYIVPEVDEHAGVHSLLSTTRDLTDLYLARRREQWLGDLYAALSSANQAIMRATTREEIAQEVCRILVTRGGLEMAWVGWIDPQTQWVQPLAWAGDARAEQYLARIRVSVDPHRPESQGPVGRAVQRGDTVVFNDFLRVADAAPWHVPARESGYAAVATSPIREQDRIVATLSVYAAREGFFEEEVVGLIRELAADMSYALDRFQLESYTRYLATHDVNTGIFNRAELFNRLEQALARWRRQGGRLAVLFIDLDGFKEVNDLYGHRAGDELLKLFAERLVGMTREVDTVSRLGGDEFVLLLPQVEAPEDVAQVAERLLAEQEAPLPVAGRRVTVGCSIGIALCPEHSTDAERLVHAADTAMYAAKEQGRNQYSFAAA